MKFMANRATTTNETFPTNGSKRKRKEWHTNIPINCTIFLNGKSRII